MKSKYAIIGGSGFVGSRLISQLKVENCYNLDKINSPVYKKITKIGDIRIPEQIVLNRDIEMVILLAAEHKDNVSPTSKYYDVNVQGTKNVLREMDRLGIKNLIFTSSVAVYGLNKGNPDETGSPDPFNHYGKSKLQAEEVIQEWFRRDFEGKSVTIIRPTVIFGERNRGNVYNLLKQISSGLFFMVGKGENRKSMAYVGNVASFIKYRVETGESGYQVFNYCDKPDLTMNELVSLVEEKMMVKIPKFRMPYLLGRVVGAFFDGLSTITNRKFSISRVRVEKFCATTQFDASKAHQSFDAPFSLEVGLDKTLDHEFLTPKKDDILFYSE